MVGIGLVSGGCWCSTTGVCGGCIEECVDRGRFVVVVVVVGAVVGGVVVVVVVVAVGVGVALVWLAVDAKTSAHKIMIVVVAVGVVDVAVGVGSLAIVANTSARTVVVIDDVPVHSYPAQALSSLERTVSSHDADGHLVGCVSLPVGSQLQRPELEEG